MVAFSPSITLKASFCVNGTELAQSSAICGGTFIVVAEGDAVAAEAESTLTTAHGCSSKVAVLEGAVLEGVALDASVDDWALT